MPTTYGGPMPRYTYFRMPAGAFSTALDELNLTMRQFCRRTGVNEKTAERWLKGELDIPVWVPVFMAMLALPGAEEVSRATAKEYLEGEDHE